MTEFFAGYALFYDAVRWLFLVLAVTLTVALALDWAARTRRVSPFSGIARFCRSTIDPMLVPVERRVLRAGGTPSSAPWWALGGAIVLGIVILSLLQFVEREIAAAALAARGGTGGVLRLFVRWIIAVLQIALVVRVIGSWIGRGEYSPWLRWAFVLTEPILRPLRRVIPTLGPIDITPIVAYFLLSILGSVVLGVL